MVMGPGVISIIHDVNGKIDGPSCINRLPKGFLKEARKAKTLKDEFARVQFAGDQVKLLTGAERTEQIWSGDEAKAIDERYPDWRRAAFPDVTGVEGKLVMPDDEPAFLAFSKAARIYNRTQKNEGVYVYDKEKGGPMIVTLPGVPEFCAVRGGNVSGELVNGAKGGVPEYKTPDWLNLKR